MKNKIHIIIGIIILMQVLTLNSCRSDEKENVYKKYMAYFEEIYDIMDKNYFQPVSRAAFKRFIKKFNTKIYAQLNDQEKSIDFVRWRSAAYLVDDLKAKDDDFSALYPPKPADEYEKTALGKKVDTGIEGEVTDEGFEVSKVEPRSNSYIKGMTDKDVIKEINGIDVALLRKEEIQDLLYPPEGVVVNVKYLDYETGTVKETEIKSEEYFKQTVFMVPVAIPGVLCLNVQRFNKGTGEDMLRLLNYYRQHNPLMIGLIIDLRGNPGGPPLAARAISSFFLPGGKDFAYFQKKGQPKAMLKVPEIPDRLRYDGPMVILIDHKTGSAAELFSGVMQRRGRAFLMGTNSAGKVFLKSMFPLEDGSMVLLVTAIGRYPDGRRFSFKGVTPNKYVQENETETGDMVKLASKYLYYLYVQKNKNSLH